MNSARARLIEARVTDRSRERRQRGSRTRILIAVVLGALALLSAGNLRLCVAYESPFDGTVALDYWNAVAIDHAGDLVTAGVSLRGHWDCTFVLAKTTRSSGAVVWRRDFPDCGEDETYESSGEEQILIDPAGDIVVGRRDIGERLFSVYKFSGTTGELLWRQMVGHMPKHGPFVHSVALDAAGNVVAGAGLPWLFDQMPVMCLTTAFAVVKLDAATGAELWRRSLRGTFIGTDACEDEVLNQVVSVAVDAAGDVIANGSLLNVRDGDQSDYPLFEGLVLKLSGRDGAEIWRAESSLGRTILSTEERLPSSLAIDSSGDVVTTGADARPYGSLTVEKFSGANGARLWHHDVTEPEIFVIGLAVTVDFRDDIAATGIRRVFRHQAPDDTSIVLLKLAGESGNELWKREIDGTAPEGSPAYPPLASDQPLGLGADADGNIVLAAGIDNAETGSDFLVTGFDGDTGNPLWMHELDGTAINDRVPDGPCQQWGIQCDQARALAVDTESIVAVGSLDNQDTGPDAFTLVLAAATGDETWRATTAGPLPEDQVCETPDGGPCSDGCPEDCPTTTSTSSTSTTTSASTTTLPGEIINADCDDGDPCTTSDRRIGDVCVGTVVGVAGVACSADRLASTVCSGERLPTRVRAIIDKRTKRTGHLLDKVLQGGTETKTDRQQMRARHQLRALASRIAKLIRRAHPLRRRLSAACRDEIDEMVTTLRQLAARLER